jgi:transposase
MPRPTSTSRRPSKKAPHEGLEAQGEVSHGQGGALVRGRAPPGAKADRAQGVVPRGRKAAGEGPPTIRMDLPLRLRSPRQRAGPLAHPPHRERRGVLGGPGAFRQGGGGGQHETHPARAGQRRVAHGQEEALRVPEGIHLEFLPSHCPELQPAERLWALSDEAVANRYFGAIEELQEALVDRCVALREQPELIRSYIRYHWWPEAA